MIDPRNKPERGTYELDRDHPLSNSLAGLWMLDEGGGQIANNLTGGVLLANAAPGFSALGLKCNSGSSGAWMPTLPPTLQMNGALSVMWRGVFNVAYATYGQLIGVNYANSDTSPYYSYGLYRDGSGYVGYYSGTAGIVAQQASTPPLNVPMTFVGVTTPSNSTLLYANGRLIASASGVSIPYTSTSNFAIGYYPGNSSRSGGCQCSMGAVWSRALSPAEVVGLNAEPYSMLRTSRLKPYNANSALFRRTLTNRTGSRSAA